MESINLSIQQLFVVVLKVIQWATHHKDDPPPPDDDENKEKRTDDIDPWDQEFLKVDQGTLFELILVSIVETKCCACPSHEVEAI